ncbi:hypothetical protein GA0116948_1052 [Chitinophaga costaii]|uniref:Uncharacterized protein n=1 Tax=Chitinophaga costaii TaxID=1335309 RepID=A0A1C4D056_9BACT|nr:hypothetical protein [Chitinophaga costaii]PUZ24407.1 hypothetical protein DCM91_10795 [Chitinophaga costaii]SCC24785.1 hypothetical protein GA0116948_1052 [Chitinophaga costaii]
MKQIVDQINERIRQLEFADAYIYSFCKNVLSIAVSQDFFYYHNFLIKFTNVFAMDCKFSWSVDASINREMIELIEGADADIINLKYHVEIGNYIFRITTEDLDQFYIAAEEIELVDVVVKYYE